MSCDQFDEYEDTCEYQVKMLKAGMVMVDSDFGYTWIPKSDITNEDEIILDDMPDFIHMHCSGGCVDVYKREYPEDYLKTCKHFKQTVREEFINRLERNEEKLVQKMTKSGTGKMSEASARNQIYWGNRVRQHGSLMIKHGYNMNLDEAVLWAKGWGAQI